MASSKQKKLSIKRYCHNKRARYACKPRSLSVSHNMTRLKQRKSSIKRYGHNKRARYACILIILSVGTLSSGVSYAMLTRRNKSPLCAFCGYNLSFHCACAFLATSHKCTIFTSLVSLSVGTLTSGISYAMLTRPKKAQTAVHGC